MGASLRPGLSHVRVDRSRPGTAVLSEHRGDARPDTLVQLFVSAIGPVVAEFGRRADDPPYGCEFELRDPDGNRLRISTATDG